MRGSMFFLMCKCFDSNFCLSASVNVRDDLHTPLGLYNTILVWYLLFPLSPLKLSFHATLHLHPFFRISSKLILQMTNNENHNINNSGDNNTRNPPPSTLEHIMAIQGQLFQTTVLMQQTILQMQSTHKRTPSRKRKNDTQGDVSHMLDEWTKKQLKTSRAQQVDYDKQIRPLSEMSPDYMNFFGFVPPSLIGGIQCTTCGKKKDIILKFA
jgi:hypothetical protein